MKKPNRLPGVCRTLSFLIKKIVHFARFLPYRLLAYKVCKQPVNREFLQQFAAKIHKSDRLLVLPLIGIAVTIIIGACVTGAANKKSIDKEAYSYFC